MKATSVAKQSSILWKHSNVQKKTYYSFGLQSRSDCWSSYHTSPYPRITMFSVILSWFWISVLICILSQYEFCVLLLSSSQSRNSSCSLSLLFFLETCVIRVVPRMCSFLELSLCDTSHIHRNIIIPFSSIRFLFASLSPSVFASYSNDGPNSLFCQPFHSVSLASFCRTIRYSAAFLPMSPTCLLQFRCHGLSVYPVWVCNKVRLPAHFRSHFESSTVYKSTHFDYLRTSFKANVKLVVRKRNVWKGVLNKDD